nr:hypothetical protein GCM10025732_45490 [Glycomyces mayteni]
MLTENRLSRLNVGPTDPSTSVAAVFDRSYRHLSIPAQRTYRLLGLHPGLDLSPALATSLTGMSTDDTATALMELTRASLLTRSAEGRYSLHDLLREHATALAERTDSDAERRNAIQRLLDHYTHTACPAAAMIRPSIDELAIPLGEPSPGTVPESLTEREAARAWFQAEHAGMAAAVLRQPEGELDVQVWQSGWALSGFYYVRGHMRDQVVLQLAALGAAERIGDSAAQVHSHRVLAWSYTGLGRFEDSHAHLTQALRLAIATEDRIAQAAAHHGLANLAALQGHHDAALEHSRRFLELSTAQGSRIGVARALNAVGWYHAQLGEYKEAIEYCERALDACQAVDSDLRPHLEAAVSDSLGFIHHRLGRYERARSYYHLALARVREAGSRRGEGEVLSSLGELHLSAGDPDAAREALQQALEILTDIGHTGADDLRRRLADL